MSETLIFLLAFSLLLAIYNTALLLSLRAKKAALLAQEELVAELLLRIRLGAVKRKNRL